ncbi:MAG: CpsD/CapB family tyrosine-protein kinase [Raoultibacter sp.]
MANRKQRALKRQESQNAFKTLFANIRFSEIDTPLRTLCITSSVPNEGKTTAAVNLAQAIASSGKRVLLVEADMRRRSLANVLQVHPANGIYDVLSGNVALERAVAATTTAGLWFLDAEPSLPNPADIVASKRYRALVEKMADAFDYVIFDTPPVSTFIDAAVVSTLVDGTLLLIKQRSTKRAVILESLEQLKKANANILGTVLTFCKEGTSDYYYAYYNASGKRVESPAAGSAAPAPQEVEAPEERTASFAAGTYSPTSGGVGQNYSYASPVKPVGGLGRKGK